MEPGIWQKGKLLFWDQNLDSLGNGCGIYQTTHRKPSVWAYGYPGGSTSPP